MKNDAMTFQNRKRLRLSRGMYILSILLLLVNFHGSTYAQDSDPQKNNWLLGVIFKLERMKDKATAEIQKCEREIQKCENTIRKAEDIINQAQQKGNPQAEKVARQALTTAQEAKRKYQENKNLAELKKRDAEIAMARTSNLLANNLSLKSEIRSVVTGYSGKVQIFKKNGETVSLENHRSGFLEPGDKIWTFGGSSAELQMLDGRGTVRLGEYSEGKMEEDGKGTQILNLLKGKTHIAIEKMGEYEKMLDEKLKEYKERISNQGEDFEKDLQKLKAEIQKRVKRFEVRTARGGGAVLGTEFLVFEDEKKGTEIIVLEGSIEFKDTKEQKTVLINNGYGSKISPGGIPTEPYRIDLSKTERWWEK